MTAHKGALIEASRAARITALTRGAVIIGGCGRSGTTLLLSLLSTHPRLLAIPHETQAFCPGGYLTPPTLDAPFILDPIHHWLAQRSLTSAHRRVCEKTPRNVLYFARLLRALGPDARLVHVVRDGRDVVTSRHPDDPSRAWIHPRRWVEDARAGARLEAHPQVHRVRYEDLILSPEPTLRALCAFLDVAFAPAMLRYPEGATVQRAPSWFEAARPLSPASIGRWRDAAFAPTVAALEREPGARDLLDRYGYL